MPRRVFRESGRDKGHILIGLPVLTENGLRPLVRACPGNDLFILVKMTNGSLRTYIIMGIFGIPDGDASVKQRIIQGEEHFHVIGQTKCLAG